MIVFATILLLPVALLGGLLLVRLAIWAKFVPGGSGAVVGYFLIICAGYGLLYLGFTVDRLIVTPALLQQQYLGERVAGFLSLVRYEEGGFQDPYQQWDYVLSDAQVERLRPHCSWDQTFHGPRICVLYSGLDERWSASVALEGNLLKMDDGLH